MPCNLCSESGVVPTLISEFSEWLLLFMIYSFINSFTNLLNNSLSR